MAGRFSRSWSLANASWQVLKQDTQLLVFPLVSTIAAVVVAGAFALGGLGMWSYDGLSRLSGERLPMEFYVLGFAFYVCLYFVIFFCNAALVGAAMLRFDGGIPTVGDGFRIAAARSGRILGYALIAATVGMVLRAIQERVGFLGRFVVGLLGVGWTVATFMVVPVLVSRDVGPIDAVKESAGLLKKTWGENVIGKAGLGLAFLVVYLGLAVAVVALLGGAVALGNTPLVVTVAGLAVVALMLVALAHAALTGIYSAALYRYATTGSGGAGFDSSVLQAAFARK
ncbi:MAG: hypothetical protein H7276_18970 [Caulobacter sp.]|nr:hypothetical protein [Vitreoscilla sp.]